MKIKQARQWTWAWLLYLTLVCKFNEFSPSCPPPSPSFSLASYRVMDRGPIGQLKGANTRGPPRGKQVCTGLLSPIQLKSRVQRIDFKAECSVCVYVCTHVYGEGSLPAQCHGRAGVGLRRWEGQAAGCLANSAPALTWKVSRRGENPRPRHNTRIRLPPVSPENSPSPPPLSIWNVPVQVQGPALTNSGGKEQVHEHKTPHFTKTTKLRKWRNKGKKWGYIYI